MHVMAFIWLMSVCFCFDDLEVTWGTFGGLINNLGLSYCWSNTDVICLNVIWDCQVVDPTLMSLPCFDDPQVAYGELWYCQCTYLVES